MKRRRIWPAALVYLGVPAIVIAGLVFGLSGGVASPQRITGDVRVGPVSLHGLSRDQAVAQLASLTPDRAGWTMRLICGERSWQPTARELGVTVDVEGTLSDAWRAGQANVLGHLLDLVTGRRQSITVPVRLRLDEAALRACLGRITAEVNLPPRNASYDLRTGAILGEADGRQADVEAVVAKIRDAVRMSVPATVELPLSQVKPATSAADLAVIGSAELARFVTFYRADAVDRSMNIALAVARLNGTIVKPGQVFSFNAAVGPRTAELGYREALEIVNGEYVPGIGGGICQVSSTVYNAGLLAGLNVVERYPHSRKPLYVEPGRDATVVYGSLDLKLRNDRKSAILIAAIAEEGALCIAIRGRAEPDEEYAIETSVLETIPALTTQEPDPTVQPGTSVVKEKPVDGLRVLVSRISRIGGKFSRQTISTDYYQPVTGVIKVAPGDALPPEPGTPPIGGQAKPSDTGTLPPAVPEQPH